MAIVRPVGETDWRRVRDIGEIDIDSTDDVQAKDINNKKDVILKQYDWGSCIHCTLKFKDNITVDYEGDSIFATFTINNKQFAAKRLIQSEDGTPLEVVCRQLANGKTEILLPKEVMQEVGFIDMEIVITEANEYRITSPAIKFKINKSIMEVSTITPAVCGRVVAGEIITGQGLKETSTYTYIAESSLSNEFLERFGDNNGI